MPGDGLVGRRLAVTAVHAEIDRAVTGLGGVLLLVGDAGMGKTALAGEAVGYARAHGATAVWGTCWEGEGAPGYWPWIQVARELTSDVAAPEFTSAAGVLSDDAAARFRTYDLTARYLRRHADHGLVVVLDDLHWADVSSLRLLLFVARQLHDVGVLVIGTCRDVEFSAADGAVRLLLAELAGQSELIHLSGLATDEVGELIHKTTSERPPGALTRMVHERTAGNPFFVQQVARLLAARGTDLDHTSAGGVPPAVGEVLRRRLARLPSEVVDIAGTAAVIGTQVSIDTLTAVSGKALDDVLRALDILVPAGVLEPDAPGAVRFAHALFREVLYDGLSATTRAVLHLAVAESLEADRDAPAAEIAGHRVAALPAGDRARAVTALVEAAADAGERTAYDEAAGLLARAIEVAGGKGVVDLDTLCAGAEALRRAGQGPAARELFGIAAARARAAGDQVVLARAAFGAHRVPTRTETCRADVVALLEEALRGSPGGWLLTASLARELSDGPDRDHERAVRLAESAVAGARADGDNVALAYGLFALVDVRWRPGTATERLRLAAELATAATAAGETELLLEAKLSSLVARLELGDPAFADEVDGFVRLAERTGIPHYRYLALSRVATRATLTGPYELADELIENAAGYGERIDEPDTWGVEASQLIGLAMLRHDWTRVSALAATRGENLTPPEFTAHEQAWLLIEAGDHAAAAAVVSSLPQRSALYRWRHAALLTAEAELAAAVRDQKRCADLYQRLLPLADEFAVVAAAVFTTGPVSLQLGLLADALDRPEDAAAHLEDAAARSDRLGARLFAARARSELARITDRDTGNVFRRDGDVWTLGYAGLTVQLRDAKGLRDLAVLLATPGREVSAAELSGDQLPQLGADPVLDEHARAAYRARLAQLDDELAVADSDGDAQRSNRLSSERDALVQELAHATGLAGRRRRLGDNSERARSTVTARIRDTLNRIERVHPALGAHLRAGVSTGTWCSYRPAETVRWTVSRS
ncbi:ATP-binding protein [Kribbella sp. NPDC004536]|uniref:ATP-binding protein n=1 Tax=Kribbella sp. NPDC004536 TaxID=3364106 RepID=UPI00369000C8